MKFKLITAMFFIISVTFPINSQSVKDMKWELPSCEIKLTGSMGSGSLPGEIGEKVTERNSDFTSAGDFYNSLNTNNVIEFKLTKPGFVNIKIYDVKGNTIDELARSSFSKGDHKVTWNSSKFSEGTFYYSVITGEYSITKKLK